MLAGLVDQVTPVSSKIYIKDSQETEKILNTVKTSQNQTKKTLNQIGSTSAASSSDAKKFW